MPALLAGAEGFQSLGSETLCGLGKSLLLSESQLPCLSNGPKACYETSPIRDRAQVLPAAEWLDRW